MWGIDTLIDLSDCDHVLITSKEAIAKYTRELLVEIDMKAFGDPMIQYFGEEEHVKGYSLLQFIYTSHVVGHFVDATNQALITISSCKPYDSDRAIALTKGFFKGSVFFSSVMPRGF